MLRLFSPAKINLFLRVVAKRSDGFHDLSSVFQTINLADVLTFQISSKDQLTCSDPLLSTDASNLSLRATDLFRRKTGSSLSLKIHLDKRIPLEAGLGGGSSNAATTLWACNQLAGQIASPEDLKQWSADLGSDVPFFFSQGTAYCTGRGEQVKTLPSLPPQSLWIAKPPEGLSTADVYRHVCLSSPFTDSHHKDLEAFTNGSLKYFNDLEEPAFKLKPHLKELKTNLLHAGFETVLMSGSGSSFFCLGPGKMPAHAHMKTIFARFINRSPTQWY